MCLLTEYSGNNAGEMDGDTKALKDAIDANNVDGFMQQIQVIISQIPFESREP